MVRNGTRQVRGKGSRYKAKIRSEGVISVCGPSRLQQGLDVGLALGKQPVLAEQATLAVDVGFELVPEVVADQRFGCFHGLWGAREG